MFNQNELINQLWYLFVIKKKRDKIAHKKLTNTKTTNQQKNDDQKWILNLCSFKWLAKNAGTYRSLFSVATAAVAISSQFAT